MKSYQKILGEIQRLQRMADKRRRKEVGTVIAEIRHKMADYGIKLEELGKALRKRAGASGGKKAKAVKTRKKRRVAPKYRDPQTGATWSGRGLTPKWLAEKEKSGSKREQFLIEAPAKASAKRRK
jgi:DNA-binding protein H-NS